MPESATRSSTLQTASQRVRVFIIESPYILFVSTDYPSMFVSARGGGIFWQGKKCLSEASYFSQKKMPPPLVLRPQNKKGYKETTSKAGRRCPRSEVHTCTGSFCSGAFTNSRNRRRFSESSTAVFHSH